MKHLLFVTFGIFLISCKKETGFSSERKSISGTWELERQFFGEGPNGGPGANNFSAGNGNLVVFDINGNFERWQQNNMIIKAKYNLGRKKDCEPSDNDLFFYTGNDIPSAVTYIAVTGDKLTISMSNCITDAGVEFYRRIK